ncbi:MAG: metallophosphoesterase [Firmicutes bacterium]|nr:metallophosphoesterase [Bacillota bacterium]
MSLFAISDLHLSFKANKPMDVFGGRWENYIETLSNNWNKNVRDEDTVVLCGDNSWATYLEDADLDFEFINSLPGKKILSKGKHDYWWTTQKKMNEFCVDNNFNTISFLQNNYYMYNDIAICGTRGWMPDAKDEKIFNRELERLAISLNAAKISKPREIIVALHYPPENAFRKVLENFGVSHCIYGHLHGNAQKNALSGTINGVKYLLVSCDYLQFNPFKLY